MLLLAFLQTARAGADEDISRALAACARADLPLPPLTAAQRAQLASGEVVKIVERSPDPNGPSTAVGVAVLDGRRSDLWLAAQDPHASVDPSLIEFVVEEKGADHMVWYGHIDLPRPSEDYFNQAFGMQPNAFLHNGSSIFEGGTIPAA